MALDEKVDAFEEFMRWLADREAEHGVKVTVEFSHQGLLVTVKKRVGNFTQQCRYVLSWVKWVASGYALSKIQDPIEAILHDFKRDT